MSTDSEQLTPSAPSLYQAMLSAKTFSPLKDEVIQSLLASRDLGLDHLTSNIMTDKFQAANKEIALYFKAVMAFLHAGRIVEANLLLDFIQAEFLQPDGDVVSPGLPPGEKSSNAEYNQYYGYINGWLCREGQRTGRMDIRRPAWDFYRKFQHPVNGGQVTGGSFKGDQTDITDFFSTANFGLTALELGDFDAAAKATKYIIRAVSLQPNIDKFFYLKQTSEGKFITDGFPEGHYKVYFLKTDQPDQLWFMLGFPLVLLAKMFQVDNNKVCKETADKILDFYDRCLEQKFGCLWSHKMALGTSYMAAVWKEYKGTERYVETCEKIVTELLKLQDKNGVFSYPGMTERDKMDQTAEVPTWWSEIAANLARAKYGNAQN